MIHFNWRALTAIGGAMVVVVIIANVAFSFMWGHGASSGY